MTKRAKAAVRRHPRETRLYGVVVAAQVGALVARALGHS